MVQKFSTGMKDMATNVTERISKEIFDDDIYVDTHENDDESTSNAEENKFNVSIQDEPVVFERLIINKVKRKIEPKYVSNEDLGEEVLDGANGIEMEDDNVPSKSIARDDLVNINNAIHKACLKVDTRNEPCEFSSSKIFVTFSEICIATFFWQCACHFVCQNVNHFKGGCYIIERNCPISEQ